MESDQRSQMRQLLTEQLARLDATTVEPPAQRAGESGEY
jgi:hypothetical protein